MGVKVQLSMSSIQNKFSNKVTPTNGCLSALPLVSKQFSQKTAVNTGNTEGCNRFSWVAHCLAFLMLMPLISGCSGCRDEVRDRPEIPQTESAQLAQSIRVDTVIDEISEEEFTARLNQAVGLMGQFKYPAAYQAFAELLKIRPNDCDLAVSTAIARLNMASDEDLQAALSLLEKVLEADSGHLRANYCTGLIKTYLGPPFDPLPHFQIAAALDPNDADIAYLLGRSLETFERWQATQQAYERCLELNEYYASAMLGLSRVARIEGDSEASQSWIQIFERMKSNPNARVFEFAYKRMGQYGEVKAGAVRMNSTLPPIAVEQWFQSPTCIVTSDLFPDDFVDLITRGEIRAAITVVDINHDGLLDLLIYLPGLDSDVSNLVPLINQGEGGWKIESELPWAKTSRVNAVLVGDIDQDGRVDLYLCRDGANQLWLQTSEGLWALSADNGVSGGEWNTVSGLLIDADHDGDLDILCANLAGPAQLLNNNRDGSFLALTGDRGLPETASNIRQIVAGDFDNQRDLDLWLLSDDAEPHLLMNQKLWNYTSAVSLPEQWTLGKIQGTVCVDFNHDGRLDLVHLVDGKVEFWSREAGTDWQLTTTRELAASIDSHNVDCAGQFALLDLSGDGDFEVVVPFKDGFEIATATNTHSFTMDQASNLIGWTPAALDVEKGWSLLALDDQGNLWEMPSAVPNNSFARIEFTGKEKLAEGMRSNRSGIGTRWKARIGDRWHCGINLPSSSLPGQSLQPQLIGMPGIEAIDFMAVDWSDGVFQAELGITPDKPLMIEETQRQLASCPLLFSWNGDRIEFVTDVLGVAGIGFMTSPGEYAAPRPWENVLLDESQVRPQDGRLIFKIGEPMEEACYIKRVSLTAIDLPADWEVVVDERMGITDPQPTGQPYFFHRHWLPVAARDGNGQDQLSALSAADRVAVDPGPIDHRFIGLLQQESKLEFSFDLPGNEKLNRPALVIEGWVEYPYSQTIFAAWQAGRQYEAPTLEISDDGKHWREVWSQFGYPAGMPRTMLLPLPPEAAQAKWMRFRSNQQIYWDRIRLVELENCESATLTELPLLKADLRHVGFALRTTHAQFVPDYDYAQRRGTWDCRHLPGFYTRLGDITELIADTGNALAAFGPGEEIHFEFQHGAAKGIDRSSQNSRRYYMLRLEGWCKDMDLYTNHSNELGPLPQTDDQLEWTEQEQYLLNKYNYRYQSGPWFTGSVND